MQVRSFVFTLNNYDDADIDAIKYAFKDDRYYVIGREVGKGGTKHLQGFVQLEKRKTLKVIGSMFPWHVESTKGTPKEASDYCKKDGNFIEHGTLCTSEEGLKRSELRWKDLLMLAKKGNMMIIEDKYPSEYIRMYRNLHCIRVENLEHNGSDVNGIWLQGQTGTGKSRFAFNFDPDSTYPKMGNKWWDGYKGQRTVVLDDLGMDHKCLGYHIKRWCDRYACVLEVKGASLQGNYETFIVTSNYSIDEIWYGDDAMINAIKRRFTVLHVIGHEVTPEGLLQIRVDHLTEGRLVNKFNL